MNYSYNFPIFLGLVIIIYGIIPNNAELPEICLLQKQIGYGRASFTRYFYNTETSQCENFTFGGGISDGQNNFQTIEECQTICKEEHKYKVRHFHKLPEVCMLPKRTGRGRASFERYFYNTKTDQCEKFIFGGGISDGQNNFESIEKCQSICKAGNKL